MDRLSPYNASTTQASPLHKSVSYFSVESPASQLSKSLALKDQLKVAIAKQVECYEKVLSLNSSLKEEIQRRQKAETEVKRLEDEGNCRPQLAEALAQLEVMQKELDRARQHSHTQDQQDQVEAMHLMIDKNHRLDAELQSLQSKVAELDRRAPSYHTQATIIRFWRRIAAKCGGDDEVSAMLSSEDCEEFYQGVLRAFELIAETEGDRESEISYSNPLLPKLSQSPISREQSHAESCTAGLTHIVSPLDSYDSASQDSSIAWHPRDRSIQTEVYSTQPSTSTSAKQPVFLFEASSDSYRQSSVRKPLLIEATEGLLEAISTQSEKLNALSKQLNTTMSSSFTNVRTPTFKHSKLLSNLAPVSASAVAYSKTSSNAYAKQLHFDAESSQHIAVNPPLQRKPTPLLPLPKKRVPTDKWSSHK
jgi:hypothetical protein